MQGVLSVSAMYQRRALPLADSRGAADPSRGAGSCRSSESLVLCDAFALKCFAFARPLAPGGGPITGFGCGESTGSFVVKRLGSPSGAGTDTRCGRLDSGNVGPPARGSLLSRLS